MARLPHRCAHLSLHPTDSAAGVEASEHRSAHNGLLSSLSLSLSLSLSPSDEEDARTLCETRSRQLHPGSRPTGVARANVCKG